MVEYQTSAPGWPLYFGRPAGSAMPLVWAHAEYGKLRRSLRDGSLFDQPSQPVQRYQEEMTPYERLLGDALRGDPALFGCEDTIEAQWRIVQPVLGDVTPLYTYEPNSWALAEANQLTVGDGGWHNPVEAAA